jgi:asparagine synthase (glutamine-hydrolysing)
LAGFILQLTTNGNQAPEPPAPRTHERMRRRGLDRWTDVVGPGYHVRLYAKILDRRFQLARKANGDMALATGTLLYGGEYGEPALTALLEDHDESLNCLRNASGQFALIVFKDGALSLTTDRGGFYHIYHDRDLTVFSSSFLAVCSTLTRCTPKAINIRERLICGAIHGPETIFEEVVRVPPHHAWRLAPERRLVAKPPLPAIDRSRNRVEMLDHCARTLVESLEPVARVWPSNLITPLTGGYDSRLLTAALRRAGADPEHLIYGHESEPDVRIATSICRERGWTIHHLDKNLTPTPPPADFAALVDRSFHFHDGRGIDGVLGDGSDLMSREQRAAGGRLYLNGSGGGVFRDALDLGKRRCHTIDVVRGRYERLDHGMLHDRAHWDELMNHAAGRLEVLFDPPTRDLDDWQIHALFPRWRLRYWMSPDNQVNNTLAPALVPFTDPAVTETALGLRQHWRDDGVFEAALIERLDPDLAAFPSSYGWTFAELPPATARWRRRVKHATPAALRRRWQRQVLRRRATHVPLPAWLGPAHQDALLGDGPLRMDEFVHCDGVVTPNRRNLLLSLELLLRAFA